MPRPQPPQPSRQRRLTDRNGQNGRAGKERDRAGPSVVNSSSRIMISSGVISVRREVPPRWDDRRTPQARAKAR
jgi:hypothetical protein